MDQGIPAARANIRYVDVVAFHEPLYKLLSGNTHQLPAPLKEQLDTILAIFTTNKIATAACLRLGQNSANYYFESSKSLPICVDYPVLD